MKRIHFALSACLALLASACDPGDGTGIAGDPDAPGAGKSDGVHELDNDCLSIELDYEECQDNAPAEVSCAALLSDEHPEAAACCDGLDGWSFCDLSTTSWCQDLTTEHLDCSEFAPPTVLCDDLTDERALSELCGPQRHFTCDDVDAEYQECRDNAPADVSCEDYIVSQFPGGEVCCGDAAEASYATCVAYE